MTDKNKNENRKEYLCIGLLAHVDAGKTTLSEAILHRTGAIRSAGRVDHGDAFLDTNSMERDRGITIFSKQASFTTYAGAERVWTLVDTPGHVDFSTEMERVLQVLDYAVLIISAADKVTGQVRTLWKLLEHYGVPAFIFVNKMDQAGADREAVYEQIRSELGSACVDLQGEICGNQNGGNQNGGNQNGGNQNGGNQNGRNQNGGNQNDSDGRKSAGQAVFSAGIQEEIAVCDEELMERFLEGGEITFEDAAALVASRRLFPVCFGSALREEGVDDLLVMLDTLAPEPARGTEFGARVYKIGRDAQGARLTYIKVTGGSLHVKDPVRINEKADQLRLYSGEKYELTGCVECGGICAVVLCGPVRVDPDVFQRGCAFGHSPLSLFLSYGLQRPERDEFAWVGETLAMAESVTNTINSLKSSLGIKSTEQVSIRCPSCGATLTGIKGDTVKCPYCGTYTTL